MGVHCDALAHTLPHYRAGRHPSAALHPGHAPGRQPRQRSLATPLASCLCSSLDSRALDDGIYASARQPRRSSSWFRTGGTASFGFPPFRTDVLAARLRRSALCAFHGAPPLCVSCPYTTSPALPAPLLYALTTCASCCAFAAAPAALAPLCIACACDTAAAYAPAAAFFTQTSSYGRTLARLTFFLGG